MWYFEVEDRRYRMQPGDLGSMEIYNPTTRMWERYLGNAAKVLRDGTRSARP